MVHDGHMNLRIALPQIDLNFNPSLTSPLPQPKPNRSFLVRGELLCLVPLSLSLSLSLSHLSPLKLVIYYKTSPTMFMLSLPVLTSKFKVDNSHNLTLNLNPTAGGIQILCGEQGGGHIVPTELYMRYRGPSGLFDFFKF